MKSFNRLIAVAAAVLLIAAGLVNWFIISQKSESRGYYRVEMNRVRKQIDAGQEIDTGDFKTITGICTYDAGSEELYDCKKEYAIYDSGDKLYRIEYDEDSKDTTRNIIVAVNIGFAVTGVFMIGLLLFLKRKMIMPFNRLSKLPYELSKGNLTEPLAEEKSRYFGKFVWGLDMLREKLETSKQKELEYAKAEKTMILSLSHDIKTPLSAIKLYSKALSKGIYTDQEKLSEVYDGISSKADEIEKYIGEIIKHSSDNFMKFEVQNRDFYIQTVIDDIKSYYTTKLALTSTEFNVGSCSNCLIYGDPDRLTEVLQNMIENAIKYGDGRDISVSFSDEENCRLITVENGGCTLSDSEQDHIFDSFWRGSNAEGKPGSGLGLYICRRLMTEMGGDIFAEVKGDRMSVTAVCKKSE